MIALVMFLLLWAGGQFGVSSTLRTFCSIGGVGKRFSFFNFDWKSQIWNVVFISGAVIGGWIAHTFLASDVPLELSQATQADLSTLGIVFNGDLVPESIFNWANLLTPTGLFTMVFGGILIGFGTRWAGGCTSGHAISGLSNLQLPSLIAVVGFFIGGLFTTFVVFPLIFG
ncbi:MAG: putative membrane protein YedE/YeeE [Flammeovirgaceae bacterium]|jgi:uncharacterized membrane protein YedE/YeeE